MSANFGFNGHILPFRFHTFSIFEDNGGNEYEESLIKNDRDLEFSSHEKQKGQLVNSIGYGVRDDVMKIWEELDTARNTLSEIQALFAEFDNPQKAKQGMNGVSFILDTL